MSTGSTSRVKRIALPMFLTVIASYLTWTFFIHTPSGCSAKIFTVGSSLCHQIPTHSFHIGSMQFPVCARCTGLYVGSFIGILYSFLSGKKSSIPKKGYLLLLTFLFLIWAGDGVNSLLSDLLNRPLLYRTTNMTRVITGYGMGLVMATALTTLFNITIWKTAQKQPVLSNIYQIPAYAAATALTHLVLFSSSTILFQTAAALTILTAASIITLLYTIFWVIIWKRENQFMRWRELGLFLLAGLSTTMAQILLLNALRSKVLF